MNFVLHPQLAIDSEWVCELPLSQVRLMNNAAFVWVLLIPRRAEMIELIDLTQRDQAQLLKEIRHVSTTLKKIFLPHKLNIANLGNMVSQLHVHIIARFERDKAWPHPVWNSGVHDAYNVEDKHNIISLLVNDLQEIIHE